MIVTCNYLHVTNTFKCTLTKLITKRAKPLKFSSIYSNVINVHITSNYISNAQVNTRYYNDTRRFSIKKFK
jgi:hypothetical protein